MKAWNGQRGNRHQRGYGRAWDLLRVRVLQRAKWLCECSECKRLGRVRLAHEVDHIIPKAKGGTDALGNLQAINRDCHSLKTIADNGGKAKPRPQRVGLDGFPLPGGGDATA